MNEQFDPNDHRRIGVQQGLFHTQEQAAGSVFWHPKGLILFRTIEGYVRDRLRIEGYEEIRTPQLIDRSLWQDSGHWDKFRENMYVAADAAQVPDADAPLGMPQDPAFQGSVLAIKPMNCPGAVQVFNAQTVSYRQLPMRLSEIGVCHRNEPSGALHGIMRLRQFTQDDAHIFCTEEQVASEAERFIRLLLSVYKDFGFDEVKAGVSTRPDKRAGSDETWDRAENALRQAVEAFGLDYEVKPGEGAFYGPKLEFAVTDIRGRQWQCGTLQLDFILGERLRAHYVAEDGTRQHPVILHRAILGSFERFIAHVLEHHEARLPPWLAPVQYAIVPIRPETTAYAERVHAILRDWGLRGIVDARDEHMNNRIKDHLSDHVPYLLVVGPRDEDAETVAVRYNGSRNTDSMLLGVLPTVMMGQCKRPTIGGSYL